MVFHELSSAGEVQAYVLHGLTRMRSVPLQPAIVHSAIEWALNLASDGHPLPPLGFVADVGVIASGTETRPKPDEVFAKSEFAAERAYEDYVISKLFGDRTLDRASDAVRRFSEQDRPRAIAFIVDRIREQLSLGGVMVGVGPIKELLDLSADKLMDRCAAQSLDTNLQQLLADQYQELISSARLAAELLAPEDIFELEQGTAISQLGQRVAVRQVIQAAALLAGSLSGMPAPRRDSPDAPTQMLDEDAYPVGGFSSISNRGSTESLLHSQLSYMESANERPDLFDVKYLRDELLYYSRDENQFFRRRRHFTFVFEADLATSRVKDPQLPFQRIIMALGAVIATIRRLIFWYCDEEITFDMLFPANHALDAEQKLIETVLRDEITNGQVSVSNTNVNENSSKARTLHREEGSVVHISVTNTDADSGLTLKVAANPILFPREYDQSNLVADWSDIVVLLAKTCAR